MDFIKLKAKYAISATDNPTVKLTITYNNGKSKTIEDYGMEGTFGLKGLYELLFALHPNQNWR